MVEFRYDRKRIHTPEGDQSVDSVIARKIARTIEPYHTFVYAAPEAHAAYKQVGLDEGRMSYFAPRTAPLGPASAELTHAVFHNFNLAQIKQFIPEAWRRASPEAILAARLAGADGGLKRMCGDQLGSAAVNEALDLAKRAVDACEFEARALSAAHAGLPWPNEPHLALWHAITILREYRTDGHYVALMHAGINALDSLVMHAAVGGRPAEMLRTGRAWSMEQWQAAADGLRSRGLVDAAGAATTAGSAYREAIEAKTDDLAMAPWRALGEAKCQRLRDLVRPMTQAIVASGAFPGRTALNDE